MDSTLPLYRQLTSRLSLLMLSFALLFIVGFSLYYQYEQDLTQLKYQQLPAIEQFNQRQQLLIKNDRLLSEIISSKYATTFADNYLTLNANLKKISDTSRNNRRRLEQLLQELKLQSENVTLLTENERRNIQLKDNVIIQLTLIADNLALLISEQSVEQKTLFRQISDEKSTARTAINRAKTFSRLIASLKVNHELHQSLIDTLVMFNQLDLQYDLAEFDYIKLKAQREISYWLDHSATLVSKTPHEEALTEQILVLNALLFSEQNTLAKWRGQLRMAIDLQTELARQKTELSPLLDEVLVVQSPKSSIIEQQLVAGLAILKLDLEPKYYIGVIAGVFLFIAIVFLCLLISLRRKIKHFGWQSITVVEELVTTGVVSTPIPALEVSTIIKSINQLSQPLHSEADFQLQQQQFQAHHVLMSRHTSDFYWQLPVASKKLQRKLSALLAGESNEKHWRHFFSRIDVRAILTSARAAKKNKCVEKLSVTSNLGKSIRLTLEYIDGTWCGSLCDTEEYRTLIDENSQLKQQLKQQNQTDKLAIITSSEDTLAIVSKAMVQRQVFSLNPGNEQYAYQPLQQLLSWSEQQRASAQLRCDDYVLTLSTVALANEIHTALANVCLCQAQNSNHIYVDMDDNLATLVTLESEFFQAMFITICQKMFTEQQGVDLNVELKVIDVNSAQQIVRVSFAINNASQMPPLIKVIDQLAFNDEVSADYDNATDNYLRDLQLVFNVDNKVCQSFDKGGKFTFDMPFALAEGLSQTSKDKTVKLAKCSILVIATEKSHRERICQALSKSKAVVETMHDLLLFQRQLSIKHLTKNSVDVIILSSEVYLSDYDLITQHLASLPTKIQPKILVIQPFNYLTLQRSGLFSLCNLPWFSEALVANVEQLLQGNSQMNILVEPEVFFPYRFEPGQVEVLVGVEEANKNQPLIRILHWLGLKLTLVSHPEHLERLWGTGRFLVVISEFTDVNVAIDEAVSTCRGVFILNSSASKKATIIDKNKLPNTWRVEPLVPVIDIQKLTAQLSPWLKMSIGTNESNTVLAQVEIGKKSPLTSLNVNKVTIPVEQEVGIDDIEQLFDVELDDKHEHEQESSFTKHAFDLNQYAQNQGSAELAAFMLDDYLTDITADAQTLIAAINEKNYTLANQTLSSLIKLANVIAAKPLIVQCEDLTLLLNEYSSDSELSIKQHEALQNQLNHLKPCIVELTNFAEAI